MKHLYKFLWKVLLNVVIGPIVSIGLLIVMLHAILFIPANVGALLFGMADSAPVCVEIANKQISNYWHYMMPSAYYACKKDAGPLNQAGRAVINWLSAPHHPMEKYKETYE